MNTHWQSKSTDNSDGHKWRIFGVMVLVYFFLGLLLAMPAEALRLKTNWGQRVGLSEKIVRGEVVEIKSYWNPDKTLIYTDVTVLVDEYLKGGGSREIIIKIPGGTVGDDTLWVSDTPQFGVGDYGVILLGSSGQVTAGPDGVYSLQKPMVGTSQQSMIEDSFLSWIKAYVNGQTQISFQEVSEETLGTPLQESTSYATISGVSPSTISAGTGSVLTVTGSGFGASRGSGVFPTIAFRYEGLKYMYDNSAILSWSDTQVQVEVRTWVINNYPYSPGSWNSTVAFVNSSEDFDSFYALSVPFGYGQAKWATSPVSYYINPVGGPSGSASAIQAAANTWSGAGANFSFSYAGTTSLGFNIDAHNVISFADLGSPTIIGQASTYSSGGKLIETDIQFNTRFDFSTATPTPGDKMDLQGIALHELGHWLFLTDLYGKYDAAKVMYGIRDYGEIPRTLTPGDQAGIQWIYPPGGNCFASSVPSDHWKGEYFNNLTLSGSPSMVRDDGNDILNFDWGSGSPSTTCNIGVDNFSVRWTRTVNFNANTYRFTVTGDDGVRLYVDGTLKLDKWFDQGATTYTVDVPLTAGSHTLKMEYYEHGGGAVAKLSWQAVTTTCIASVPSDRWKGEYFNNLTLSGSPSMVRDDGNDILNFDWGSGSPSTTCNIGADNFSVRWTRTVNFNANTYRFTVTGDDGVRLYVDGTLKLDKWFDQGATTYTVDVPFTAGSHTLKMEYYEHGGGAVAKLSWQVPPPPGQVDLVVQSMTFSVSPVAVGGSTRITFDVKNQGSASAGSHREGLYIDGNLIASKDCSGLAAGASQSWYYDYANVPATPNPHVIMVRADKDNQVSESNETNNERTDNLPVGGGPGGWITIKNEGFEGAFPGQDWIISGNPTWGADNYKPYNGSQSGWCARGGSSGLNPSVTNYANNMDAWMEYGPFDLSDATDAVVTFYHWTRTELNYDSFSYAASIDDNHFYGFGLSGNWSPSEDRSSWNYREFDLKNVPTIGDLRGEKSVWILFYFHSDSSNTNKGTFLDEITIKKK